MNLKQIFPSPWIDPDDLAGRRVEVVIAGAEIVEVHNRRTNEKEERLALRFERATKRMLLNKTQAFAIADITGSVETDTWAGHHIALRAGRAPNGKPTIVVERPAVPPPNGNGAASEHPAA